MISTVPSEAFLRGAAEVERTDRGLRPHRLPTWVREQFPDPQLLAMEAQPSGVRLALWTTGSTIELVSHPLRVAYRGMERARGRVDLVVDGEFAASDELADGDAFEVDLRTGETSFRPGPSHTSTFTMGDEGGARRRVELWLPHNESIELIELRTDESVAPAEPVGRTWVHHGSSISHGSNAAGPGEIWPVVAARQGGVSLRNLGLGGSALVDPFLARVIRDAPADLISVKLGINVVNLDAMRLRAFVPAVHGFLDTIRDGHPGTPLVLISPIFCGIHEDTPGPGSFDPATLGTGQVRFVATGNPDDVPAGRLSLNSIREAMGSLVKRRSDDANLHYLDGRELYGEADAVEHPLPDALHPDTASHRIIGERFARYAFGAGGPFSAP